MKFGARIPNSGPLASRDNVVRVGDEAQKLGFHSLWVHDHIVWGTEQHRTHLSAGSAEALNEIQHPNFFESITTLSYLTGRLKEIKIGIAVIVLPLRNPVVLAKQLAILDVMSEGKLMIGVAPGASNITRPEFEAVGVPYDERGKITDEYIRAIRTIWNEDLPSFSGKYINFEKIQIFPKPRQNPLKILIGGSERGISPRALRRVVELGDGWIPAYLTADEIAQGMQDITEASQKQGRVFDGFLVSHELFTLVNENSLRAHDLAKKSLLTNFATFEEAEKRSLVGTPEEIIEKVRRYSKAGVDITELKFVYSDIPAMLEMMQLYSDKIIPACKD
ncbi:MAG: TIGR03619 family F420-dependent LLM class oxidoreductase [Thaumarchaeota archaeon]|nr:TIGR03619 family F420-dependent LLM class oxidoreductase [Nitrososphaerota archaeon]